MELNLNDHEYNKKKSKTLAQFFGKKEEAIKFYDKANEMNKDDSSIYIMQGKYI